MTIINFLIKEFGRILLKKEYKEHSDIIRGVKLYRTVPSQHKKSPFLCFKEILNLFNYWKAFPDTYFRFGMFLKDYTDWERMKSFIPQGAYYRYSTDSDPRYHLLIDDKIIFHDILSYYRIPVPTRFFIFRDDEFRNGIDILTDHEVDSIISNITDERIFVKRFTGGAASGISIFCKKEDGIFLDKDGDIVSASLIRRKFSGQDYIFEKQIVQEPELNKFNPDTVNTIRVLTYRRKVIAATVRFGGKGSFVDNTAKGGVAVSLDIESGLLQLYGMREYDLTHYYEHPGSHHKFENTIVSQWPAVKNLVEKTLKYLPFYNSVGFDVATTENGPIVIEINTGAGIYLSQMGKNYGLAHYFKK